MKIKNASGSRIPPNAIITGKNITIASRHHFDGNSLESSKGATKMHVPLMKMTKVNPPRRKIRIKKGNPTNSAMR